MDKGRRDFLTKDFIAGVARLFSEITHDSNKNKEKLDYFSCFETCYPIISEAGELLFEEANKLGISVEGKSREEVAREIFSHFEQKQNFP